MRPIRARHLPLAALLLAAPAEFDTTQPAGVTTVRVHGGGGKFALISRGCSGSPPQIDEVDYGEIAGEVRHQQDWFVAGVRAGVVDHKFPSGDDSIGWINPYLGAEWEWLGLSAGYFGNEHDFPLSDDLTADIPMSAHVRLGPERWPHPTLDVAAADPLYSSGGILAIGAGLRARSGHYFWAGAAAEPFDQGGLALRADLLATERLEVLLRARAGESEGVDEVGFSAGLGWRLQH